LNAVEIEEAVSKLVEQEFEAAEFPYAFLEAFGNKPATIKRLRNTGKNTTNKSDVRGDDVVAVLPETISTSVFATVVARMASLSCWGD
jgi:hypothetical protein